MPLGDTRHIMMYNSVVQIATDLGRKVIWRRIPLLKRGSLFTALFALLLSFMLIGCGDSKPPRGSSNPVSQSEPQPDKKAVYDEINKILDLEIVKKENDAAERTTFYRPFTGFGLYPSWQVTQIGDTVRMDAVIVDGTKWDKEKGTAPWVYWHTIIFSTDEKKWEYQIPNCDGHTGGGKEVSKNNTGKYEYYETAFYNLAPGYRLLVEGTNPRIRLKGVNKRKDMKVTAEMVAALKAGLRLDELFVSTRGKIERAQ